MVTAKLLGLLLLLVTAYSSPAPKKLLADEDTYRLPTAVVPTKYTISLVIPDTAFGATGNEFDGTAVIDFTVNAAITEIKFHVSEAYIAVSAIQLNNLDLDQARGDYSLDPITDILTIPTEGMSIEVGNSYSMTITYQGAISTTDHYGLYKTSYTNAQAQTVVLATQFQAVYARRMFPCFDEPSFKATYDVSVTYPSTRSLTVLFNTKSVRDPVLTDETYTVTFETTPKMSSYLVALVISDFTSTAAATVVGDATVTHTVWSRDNMASSRDYAQQIGPLVLQHLNAYTGRLYSEDMTKVDQVALPELSVGAMENWGLITHREPFLLWNAVESSTASKQSTVQIIAHELAHQWFGNLITCNWWSEAFLNEGFATYLEYVITQQIEPTWQMDKQFVVDILQPILGSDSQLDSLALQSTASTPQQISEKFGQITYNKGGSIARMLAHIMGEENFQAGIQEYFTTVELLHGTSVPSQLWDILQKHVKPEVSALPEGVTLTMVMQNWVEKPGYPLLTVTLDGRTLVIQQERFNVVEETPTTWYVPISYTLSTSATKFQDTNPVRWLTPEEPDIAITLETDNPWVILNNLQTGYYRVTYNAELWTNITTALKSENFDGIVDLNRAEIVDDLFNLAQATKLTYSAIFTIMEDFLRVDTSYYTWVPAFKGFNFIMQKISEGTVLRTAMEAQLLNLTDALYKSVPIETLQDDQIYTKTQVLAISWACKLGLEDCVTKVNAIFDLFKTAQTKPNKNLRSAVYCSALRHAEDVTNYDFLRTQYGTADITEKSAILNSLGCTTNEEKLTELLNEIIAANSVLGAEESLTAFAAVYSGSQRGTEMALEFLIANLPAVFTKISSASSQQSLIRGLAGKLITEGQVEQLRTLVNTHADFPAAIKEASGNALTQAQANIRWASAQEIDLMTFYGIEIPTTTERDGASTAQINMVLLVVVSALSMFGLIAM